MKPIRYTGQSAEQLFGVRDESTLNVEQVVKEIILDVRERGDCALKEYNAKFDGYHGNVLEADDREIEEAMRVVSCEYRCMLERAIENIRNFHTKQMGGGFEIKTEETVVGQKITPVAKAGIYVPGGTAAYPSTVLMTAVPAKIAGVEELVMVTPVKADGKIKAEVLVAANLCGVDRIFKIGGAQAIAALAYGTETVPKVDKIVGPGNIYVATAKKTVAGVVCGIDSVAGPSEILVLADRGADPVHVAADLLSQAEHDVCASAVLFTDCEQTALDTIAQLEMQLKRLSRGEIAKQSIRDHCKIVVTENLYDAIDLANEYAPEHLELCVNDPFLYLERVRNAGSVFLGYHTPEAVGDYYAGTNHTLPTCGSARFSSPLGVNDFIKTVQYVYYSKSALASAASDITMFAGSEGLTAHAESINVRVKK